MPASMQSKLSSVKGTELLTLYESMYDLPCMYLNTLNIGNKSARILLGDVKLVEHASPHAQSSKCAHMQA